MKARFAVLLCLMVALFASEATAGSSEYGSKSNFTIHGRDKDSFQESFLRNLRAIEQKRETSFLGSEFNHQSYRGKIGSSSAKETSDLSPEQLLAANTATQDAAAIYSWLKLNQQSSPLGLVASYPQDPTLSNQGFTYDQALAGILLLKQGDTQNAKKLFDFYNAQWDGSGFWTVYNTQSVNGYKIEYEKHLGPNAWIGLFCLQYYAKTGNSQALSLATQVGKWVSSLPHQNGGVAMGANSFWAGIFSVENNLDYYAFMKKLSTKAVTSADRSFFLNELNSAKGWLKTQGYDSTLGIFKRGGGSDPVKAFDTNSWAILAIGVDTLKKDFGIDAGKLIANTEKLFSVQADGSFGNSLLTSKGFDFSDAVNAATIGRTGIKWVEGTNHMIDVYKQMAVYYQNRNRSLAAYYRTRADYFISQNDANKISSGGTLSFAYSDAPGAQVFSDNPYWKTAAGSSVASTAWAYFSLYGFNPFTA